MSEQLQQWSDLNKGAMASFQQFADINRNLFMSLAQQQMSLVGIYVESGTKYMEAVSKAKDFQDVLSAQSRTFEEFNRKVLENFRSTMEMMVGVKGQLVSLAEKSTKEVVELNPAIKLVK
ncbi:phasin family protein [Beggiatoa leptomitoformis]|uniref:Phasin family protein n=1 Tax=Beggiatoa leptomitoformis TaxID=288004 RepID=A0A2N9YE35_9GAMM|nr:phasin family protein [Beggiatoa leptomitoformis]ALG68996.1 phasin family protein [Beggiatoa leptomitoformis]AUI68609.1 phasin family protein [Beggiatoa leptomitoformis]